MKCPANNDVIRRRDLDLKTHSKDRRSGRSILRLLGRWSSVLSTTRRDRTIIRQMRSTDFPLDGWMENYLLARERERERD